MRIEMKMCILKHKYQSHHSRSVSPQSLISLSQLSSITMKKIPLLLQLPVTPNLLHTLSSIIILPLNLHSSVKRKRHMYKHTLWIKYLHFPKLNQTQHPQMNQPQISLSFTPTTNQVSGITRLSTSLVVFIFPLCLLISITQFHQNTLTHFKCPLPIHQELSPIRPIPYSFKTLLKYIFWFK